MVCSPTHRVLHSAVLQKALLFCFCLQCILIHIPSSPFATRVVGLNLARKRRAFSADRVVVPREGGGGT